MNAGKLFVVVVGWCLAHPASRPTGMNLRVVAFRSCLIELSTCVRQQDDRFCLRADSPVSDFCNRYDNLNRRSRRIEGGYVLVFQHRYGLGDVRLRGASRRIDCTGWPPGAARTTGTNYARRAGLVRRLARQPGNCDPATGGLGIVSERFSAVNGSCRPRNDALLAHSAKLRGKAVV